MATTLPRIPGPRGHQKAGRQRPHCGLKSKPFFDGWGAPAATAWLWVTYQAPSNRGWHCLLRPLLSHLLSCPALPLLRLLLPRRCSRQRLLYKIGGGRDVCSISRGLRVKRCCTTFDFRPLDSKRAGAVNLKSWKSYCECHPKILQRYPR